MSTSRPRTVLLIGEEAANGLTASIGRGFEELGWQVLRASFDVTTAPLRTRLGARVPVVLRGVRRRVTDRALAAVRGQVDLVLVVKGPFTGTRDVERLRHGTGAPVVCWNPDDPTDPARSNSGFGLPAAVPAYDAYVTWADDVAERLARLNRAVSVIPFGVDDRVVHPAPPAPEVSDRVVFVGTWTRQRAEVLQSLASLRPVVYGNDWPEVPGVECRGAVYGAQLCAVLGSARWSLNLLRPQNRRSHNMRSFEIPACEGVQLAVRTPDHERYLDTTAVCLVDDEADLLAAASAEPPPRVATSSWRVENSYAVRVRALLDSLGL